MLELFCFCRGTADSSNKQKQAQNNSGFHLKQKGNARVSGLVCIKRLCSCVGGGVEKNVGFVRKVTKAISLPQRDSSADVSL